MKFSCITQLIVYSLMGKSVRTIYHRLFKKPLRLRRGVVTILICLKIDERVKNCQNIIGHITLPTTKILRIKNDS